MISVPQFILMSLPDLVFLVSVAAAVGAWWYRRATRRGAAIAGQLAVVPSDGPSVTAWIGDTLGVLAVVDTLTWQPGDGADQVTFPAQSFTWRRARWGLQREVTLVAESGSSLEVRFVIRAAELTRFRGALVRAGFVVTP